ncbi:MAG: histidinol phosphate phosphatase [Sphingomonas bacterium]|nr:histidinol phosphate phosphatase [Sphingomonas bacterium]
MDPAFFLKLSSVARRAIEAELTGGLVTENKAASGFDPVTTADRAAERALRALIEQHYPDHGIWGEEYGLTRGASPIRWSLDPVDGTRALICGLPSWAILVGLIEDGRHVAGMIDLPALSETLIGHGGVTTRNGAIMRTSSCALLSEARLATTDASLFSASEAAGFERVRQAARVTRFGLDALGYARIATGDIDLVIESGLKPHDYDALVAVVRGAGGVIGNWSGGAELGGGDVVAAASQPLYDEAVALLAS